MRVFTVLMILKYPYLHEETSKCWTTSHAKSFSLLLSSDELVRNTVTLNRQLTGEHVVIVRIA